MWQRVPWTAILMVLVGLWFLVRDVFHLGPWFAPMTFTVLTGFSLVTYFRSYRSTWWLVITYLCGAAALFKAADALAGGTLPGSFLLAFWGLAFMAIYGLHTRPLRWPLIPASLFMAVATFFYVLGVGIETARYWVPVALVVWGLSAIFNRRRSP